MTRHVTTRVLRLTDDRVFSSSYGAALNILFSSLGDGPAIYLTALPRGRVTRLPGQDFSYGIISGLEHDVSWCCDGYLPSVGPNLDRYTWIFNVPPRGLVEAHYPHATTRYIRSQKRRNRFAASPIRRALFQWIQLNFGSVGRPRIAVELLAELIAQPIRSENIVVNEDKLAPKSFELDTSPSGLSRHLLRWRSQYERGWGLEIGSRYQEHLDKDVRTFAFLFDRSEKFISGFSMLESIIERPGGITNLHQKPVLCLTTGKLFPSIKEAARKFQIGTKRVMHNCEGDVHGVETRSRQTTLTFKYAFEVKDYCAAQKLTVQDILGGNTPKHLDAIDRMFTKIPKET